MRRDFFYAFGIDKRSTAIVASFMAQWPHLSRPDGFGNHLFLDELERKGSDFVCRMFGDMVLGSLRIAHPAAMNKYVFEPITPAPLIDNDSNIERLPPVERGVILPFHVAVGLSNSAVSLEFVDHDADPESTRHGARRTTARAAGTRPRQCRDKRRRDCAGHAATVAAGGVRAVSQPGVEDVA
jgi:hypothetical protein